MPVTAGSNPTALPKPGQPWENSLGMKFAPVPGVDVLFGVWAVRVQDFQAFVTATGRAWPKRSFALGPTHPSVHVSWEDATVFCAWLTEKERAAGRLGPTQSYRLPQDWEWSVAVGLNEPRGGTPESKNTKIRNVYPWGTAWRPPQGAGNYASSLNMDTYANTSPVGSFAANRYGLYDMGGNVWQWCEDFYNGSSGGRVLRGASFSIYDSISLLSSYRSNFDAGSRHDAVGFRCVVGVGASAP
jgi:formylglycine-generating enzyme required for sulfatase activity